MGSILTRPKMRHRAERTTTRSASAAVLGIALLHWSCHLRAAEAAHTADKPSSAPTAITSTSDTVTLITASEELRRTTLARLKQAEQWRDLNADTEAREAELANLASKGRADAVAETAPIDLVEREFQLRQLERAVSQIVDSLSSIVRRLESDQAALEAGVQEWQERVQFAQKRGVPEPVLERARSAMTMLESTNAQVQAIRDDALLALDRAVELRGRILERSTTVAVERNRVRAGVMRLEEASLWQLIRSPLHLDWVAAELHAAYSLTRDYLARQGPRVGELFAGALLLTYWLLWRGRQRDLAPAQRAYGLPAAGAFLIAVMTLWWLAPAPPVHFYAALLVLLPIPAAIVARQSFGTAIPLTIYGIGFASTLLPLRGVVESAVIVNRVILMLQALAVGLPIAFDLRSGRLFQAFPSLARSTVRGAALVIIAAAALAFLEAVIGFTGPIAWLRAGLGGLLGAGLVYAATAVVLYGAALALLDTPLGQCLRSARARDPGLLRALRFILAAFAVAGVVTVVLGSFSLWPTILSAMGSSLDATLNVGAVTISAGAVATAVGVALATLLAVKVIGFILEREILSRLPLRPGTGYAISTFTRWAIVISGTVLTLVALGIDTTKVTLLAGALGVGIGFGLQSIVNNFVSGLILIVERPVHVGDLIEVGPLLAEVRRIGIRSSTVRTMQGAEVIMPNSELVSKEVINWTRSDRQRRYDIDVGVAYGSKPEQVMRLLEEAAREVPEIMTNPAPLAMFVGFGDSSLNFRLLAWVQTIDVGVQAQNGLRIAILRKLDAAGIPIPFPQRDVHVRSPEGVLSPPAASSGPGS